MTETSASYFRYHIASGHIDVKVTVIEDEHLSNYALEGYAFEPTELALGGVYFKDGEFRSRMLIDDVGVPRFAGLSENIVITDLPFDSWVKIGNSDPVKTANGTVSISPDPDGQIFVELVGKYEGRYTWSLNWEDLDAIKTRAKKLIDAAAEAARGRVATMGAGQSMTYLRKADAARLYLAGVVISAAQLQRIQDEADRNGQTLAEAAQSIVNIADQWETLDGEIDNLRLIKKAAVSEAANGSEVEAVQRSITWPV